MIVLTVGLKMPFLKSRWVDRNGHPSAVPPNVCSSCTIHYFGVTVQSTWLSVSVAVVSCCAPINYKYPKRTKWNKLKEVGFGTLDELHPLGRSEQSRAQEMRSWDEMGDGVEVGDGLHLAPAYVAPPGQGQGLAAIMLDGMEGF
ncbi:hypothetical protein SAY86_024538 [Trapa natans]|uniref:Uncharacterized protein n=1 Tax=Trapa natans TaxID=22666 RepID=A0AAN7RJT2_TRANT|nr:hypothetical protein SAY86_024538 [Trapa natans]